MTEISKKKMARSITWNVGNDYDYYTEDIVKEICEIAGRYNFKALNIPTDTFPLADGLLSDTDVNLAAPIGDFSWYNGHNTTREKMHLAEDALKVGAKEVEFIMNIGAFKEQDYDKVRKDIEAVVDVTDDENVFVIIETPWLDKDEIVKASEIVEEAGADFVKTSKGLGNETQVEDVETIKDTISEDMKIKASGGIRTREKAAALIKAGANRLGTSSAVSIMKEFE
ncbi:MAG: deoxyribose-phosphate aldolase [Candidatus Hadarchaeia archaeon]